MPGEHAYFSPSGASRWLKCPASLYLSEKIPEEASSPYAHEGTVCHTIAADCITKNIAPTDFNGKTIEGVPITQELVDGIQVYVDEVRGLAKEYEATTGKIEYKVVISGECWGTVDALLWNRDTLIVCDLKMGKGVVVQAEDNDQLKLYSAGAIMTLAKNFDIRPTKIVNVIIQPRTPDPIRKVEFSKDELHEWFKSEVRPILQDFGRDKKGPVGTVCTPGEVQCRWCPVGKQGCSAEANKNINDAQRAFSPFTETGAPVVEGKSEILTIGEMAELKQKFSCIKHWMEKIDNIISEKAFAGERIPGFKLVEGRSIRVWNEDEKIIVSLLESLHVEPYVKKLVSPAQAEKAVGKKHATASGLVDLIMKPTGKPTLVPQSDKRAEINTKKDVEEAFCVDAGDATPTLVVDVKEEEEGSTEIKKMSALQRMKMVVEEEETVVEEPMVGGSVLERVDMMEEKTVLDKVKSATGGSLKSVVTAISGTTSAVPPARNTKRFKVLEMGKGGDTTLGMAADALGCTENMVKMHLKYLNERDGYNYTIYNDFTFKITEGD